MWLDVWENSPHTLRLKYLKAWDTYRTEAQKRSPKHRWSFGRGPISATINTLLDAGWYPKGPTLWRSPRNENINTEGYDAQNPATRVDILQYITQDLISQTWKLAANHTGGQGLEQGPPDLDVAKYVRRKLIGKGPYAQATALDQVVCGGSFKPLEKCPPLWISPIRFGALFLHMPHHH